MNRLNPMFLFVFIFLFSFPSLGQQVTGEKLQEVLTQVFPLRKVSSDRLKAFKAVEVDLNKDQVKELIVIENPNVGKKVVAPKICPCNARKWRGKNRYFAKKTLLKKALYQSSYHSKKRVLSFWVSTRFSGMKALSGFAKTFCYRTKKYIRRWKVRTIRLFDTDTKTAIAVNGRTCSRVGKKRKRRRRKRRRRRRRKRSRKKSSIPFKTIAHTLPVCGCPVAPKFKKYRASNISVFTKRKLKDGVEKWHAISKLKGFNPQLTPLTKDQRWVGLRVERVVSKNMLYPKRTYEDLFIYDIRQPNRLKRVFSHLISQEASKRMGKKTVVLSYKQMDSDSWIEIIAEHFYEDEYFHGGTHKVMYKWHKDMFVHLNKTRGIAGVRTSKTFRHPLLRKHRKLTKIVKKRVKGSNLVDGFANTLWASKKLKRGIGAWGQVRFTTKKRLLGIAVSTRVSKVYHPWVADISNKRRKVGFRPAMYVQVSAGVNWKKTYALKGARKYHFLRFPKPISVHSFKVTIVRTHQGKSIQVPEKERAVGVLSEIIPIEAKMKLTASSFESKGATVFSPMQAVDGMSGTGWGEGMPGAGIGEWLEVVLPMPKRVTGLRIINGCHLPGEKSILNNRIQTAKVVFSNGSSQTVKLKDTNKAQIVKLQPVRTSTVKLIISSIYKGKLSNITCLSEISVQ